ncbi:MAG: formamidopyrimidine-DNA glycosylase [Candidatus Thermoplasmatota archaeon]|nr:formamidopyrimidine-DNA glycosylase [Candidatus Thermoplasmatota archaeon]
MPELPEVEKYKRYVDYYALNQKIRTVTIRNTKILQNISKHKFESILLDQQFIETRRIGKYLFLRLSDDNWLVFHFGMTGNIYYFKNLKQEPNHSRLLIRFTNNNYLSYDCQRLFGFVRLIKNLNKYRFQIQLGSDALFISKKEFLQKIDKRTAKVKSVLMNQHFLSGIGNIYADEICFQTRIHPAQPINKISTKKIDELYNTISTVLNTAIYYQADFSKYPKEYIIPHRKKNGNCPLNKKHDLKTIKISGRTTYYCPIHQKKINKRK